MKNFIKGFFAMFLPSLSLYATILIVVLYNIGVVQNGDPLMYLCWIFAFYSLATFYCPNVVFEYGDFVDGYDKINERKITISDDSIKVGPTETKYVERWKGGTILLNIIKFMVGKIIVNWLLGIVVFWIIVIIHRTDLFDA